MDIELIEIRDFLAKHPPFAQLPADDLIRLPQALSIRYCRRGMPFPPHDIEGAFVYILRKGALERRAEDGSLLEKLGEGELYTQSCQRPETGTGNIHTVEDTLFYLLPCELFEQLKQAHESFRLFFTSSRQERLQQALGQITASQISGTELLTAPVRQLIRQAPVHASPEMSIREAARLMTQHQSTAILVMENQQVVGLLTDSDLRARCIGEGLSYDSPVKAIMSRDLQSVESESSGLEAVLTMARYNIHHLPVMQGETILGMLSSRDLLRYERVNAVELVEDIRRSATTEELYVLAPRLPELQLHLLNAGADANQTGQALSTVADALTGHLIALAIAELGEAPVPFVWLAAGSHGRRELSFHADQDNALILDNTLQPEQEAYFEQLALRVREGLARFGFVPCPGEVMATNPQWRQTLRVWQQYFDSWITNPAKKALMLANNFFDLRPVYGERSLFERLQTRILTQAEHNRIFLAHMASNALHNEPPLGFFRNFVLIHDGEHDNTFNLKHTGLIPIIDLARVYALSCGLRAVNTKERLSGAAGTPSLSQGGAADLKEAWQFIATLRMCHQNQQYQQGLKVDNYLSPETLSSLERNHLKEAFSVIRTMQQALEQRFQTGRFT